MKVYERLADAFKAEGTTHVFGMMGDGNMYWMNALHQARRGGDRGAPRRRGTRDGGRLGAAHALARRRDGDVRPGRNSACDGARHRRARRVAGRRVRRRTSRRAIRIITSGSTSRVRGGRRDGFIRLATPEFADEAVRRAFYLAKLESRPIMLSCPMDIQQKPWEDDEPYKPSSTLPVSAQ